MPERGAPLWTYGALAVAVVAVSSSALLVRWADIGAVSLAFWRTAGGAAVLTVPTAARWARGRRRRSRSDGPDHPGGPHRRDDGEGPDPAPRPGGRRRAPWLAVSGLALAVHFATWLASLELTSVAASVTLVTTTPLLLALGLAATGRRLAPATWMAIALAVAGSAVIAGGDWQAGGRALAGDGLALIGAGAMAVYLGVGDRLRATMGTTDYALAVYALAAAALGPVALTVDGGLGGYAPDTWLVIGAMIVGPQLAGHTVLNLLLRPLGSVTVSLALLTETVGATLGAWLLLSEAPPLGAVIGAPAVMAGLALHLWAQSTSRRAANRS